MFNKINLLFFYHNERNVLAYATHTAKGMQQSKSSYQEQILPPQCKVITQVYFLHTDNETFWGNEAKVKESMRQKLRI